MNSKIWKILAGLFVLALLIGGGAMLYRAGYAQGAMSDMSFETMPFAEGGFEGMAPYHGMPYGMRSYHGHMGFFSLGRFLFGMLFFFLFFGAIFRFFGMRRYMSHAGYKGKGGPPWMHGRYRHHGHPCGPEETDGPEENAEASEESEDKSTEA